MVTQERLKELFSYDPMTGIFVHRISRGPARVGHRAGSPSGHGYRKIVIDYERFYEHHLAWLYIYGEWPDELDHVDRDGNNNRISNLRKASRSQNNVNSMFAKKGAYFDRRTNRWFSKIQVNHRSVWLGDFCTAEEAHDAYSQALTQYYGDFVPHEMRKE
jgi:hypothetical protein